MFVGSSCFSGWFFERVFQLNVSMATETHNATKDEIIKQTRILLQINAVTELKGKSIQLLNVETSTPYLIIDNQLYKGSIEQPLGSMFELKGKQSISRVLKFQQVPLKPKD
jgi:hypothetical protein